MQPNQKMIQQLQAKLMKIQEDLGNETVEASVGGVVTVVMTGHHEVRSVKIDPEAVDPSDVEKIPGLF
jgi:DNA-binding protein YbaB